MGKIRDMFAAAIGRPRLIEGEKMAADHGQLASMTTSKSGGVYFLPVDEIVKRQGWKTYKEMRFDDQVKATLAFKRILIAGRTWDLKPAHKIKPPPKPVPLPPPPPVIDGAPPGKDAPPKDGKIKATDDFAFPPKSEDPNAKGDAPAKPKGVPPPPPGMQPGREPDGSEYVPPTAEEQAKADKAEEVRNFVEWALERINIEDVFDEALTALEYGYSLGELVFERSQYEGKQVVCLKKIGFRDPQYLELKSDKHGNFLGAKQYFGADPVELPPEKLFLFTYNGRFGNLYGEPDLRAAYRSWWAKKFIINFWNVYLERMGSPMTKMSYPQGASDELKETLKRILRNLASKTEILVPAGVEVELIEAQRAGSPTYQEALGFHNDAIARSMLMVALLGVSGNDASANASDSQSALHLRILFKMADGIAQKLQRDFMQQVVKQLVEYNFDGEIDDLMPEFIWQDYGQFEGMKVADTIRLLHAAGILDLDQQDVNYARSVLGLPLREGEDRPDAVQRPQANPPPGNANAPPPSAGQGNERAKKGGGSDTPAKASAGAPKFRLKLEELTRD